MKWYTVEIEGREEIAVSFGGSSPDAEAYDIESSAKRPCERAPGAAAPEMRSSDAAPGMSQWDKRFQSAADRKAYLLRKLGEGFDFRDMNDLICNMTDAQKEELRRIQEEIRSGFFGKDDGRASEIEDALIDLGDVKLCAPIVSPRQDLICLGINYDEHAKEAGNFSEEAFGGERPYTIYFSKRAGRLTGTGDPIPAYEGLVDSLDYEAELGVILGRDARNVRSEDAEKYIFGYTVINDVSARNLQTRHKQWYLGKSLDGFAPMGPCIVTADEIEDVQNLEISCYVNGEKRQHSNTKYMIQNVADTIEELSAGMTLLAGTIIATGTPAGVGMGMTPPVFLKPGDEVVCEIERIGRIVNTVD